ncbi:hypothetical protein Glove_88g31 [Diversispora epigaea]|uniref:Methyltransferase domain-containing protein n=1 Tax=Diversispora epigaea TaxID=1348612 RepID=A0A397J5W8_9GLOM|nr:hypothetical protein Glove_88g31 [Diversispora epigaea]
MGHPNSKDKIQRKSTQNIFRYAGGRRFHNVESSNYFLPNDDEEVDRLQLQHFLFRDIWDGNFSSPINDFIDQGGANILDVGCGPGTWLLEMSTEYPRSSFTGIDMSPIFPVEIKPCNLNFQVANVLEKLPFPDNSFDFVYMRFLLTAFTEKEWIKAIQELIRVVKPGGWLELMEGDLAFNPEGPIGRILMNAFRSTLLAKSINPKICLQLQKWLSSSPQLHNFSFKEKSGPIGSWAGSIGELACQDFCGTLHALRPILTAQLNKNPVEYDEMVAEFGKECNENKTNFSHFRFFCQKLD